MEVVIQGELWVRVGMGEEILEGLKDYEGF